jgi:uncharacterized cupin superfamily protein
MSAEDLGLRPGCIAHWSEVEGPDDNRYPGLDELMSINGPIGDRLGLTRIGIHHERLPPGRRTSLPHAESAEEEFVFVLEGTPDVWLDGVLHRLRPGDAVGFPAGTGMAHTFINDSEAEVRLLVVGDRNRAGNRILYPLHPQARNYMEHFWEGAPEREIGPHDGKPQRVETDTNTK